MEELPLPFLSLPRPKGDLQGQRDTSWLWPKSLPKGTRLKRSLEARTGRSHRPDSVVEAVFDQDSLQKPFRIIGILKINTAHNLGRRRPALEPFETLKALGPPRYEGSLSS